MLFSKFRIKTALGALGVLAILSGCTTTYDAGIAFSPAEVRAVPPAAQEMVAGSIRLAIDDAMGKGDFAARVKGRRISLRIQGALSFGYEALLGYIKAEVEGAFGKAGAIVVDDVFVADGTAVILPPAVTGGAYDYLAQVDLSTCGISHRVEGPKDTAKLALQIATIVGGCVVPPLLNIASGSPPQAGYVIAGIAIAGGGGIWMSLDPAVMVENHVYEARTALTIHLLPQDPAGAYAMTAGEGRILLDSEKAAKAR